MSATSAEPQPADELTQVTRSRVRRGLDRWRSIPVLVRASTGAFAGLMLAMMYLYPANYGFDEPQHVDYAFAFSQGHGPYAPANRYMANGVLVPSHTFARGYPPRESLADHPIPARGHRKSFMAYGGDTPTKVPNQMTQHPPLYYLVAGAVLAFPGVSHLPWDVQVGLVRLLSMLMLLPLPWLAYATARRLGVGDQLASAASLVPLLLPSLARSGASVNNDALLNLAGAAALYLVVKVITGDNSRRTAIWLSVWVLVALLTKGWAMILPTVALLAYLIAWRRFGANVLRSVVLVAVGSGLGCLWWLHNKIAYGKLEPDGFPKGYIDARYQRIHPGPERGTFGNYVHEVWTSMVDRFWGSIGLIESPDYNWSFALIGTIVLVVLVGLGLARGLGGHYGHVALFVPLGMMAFTMAIMASAPWKVYHRYVLLPGVQGRYLYPTVGVLAGLAMLGLGLLVRGRAQAFVAPVLLIVAAYAQLWTLRALVHAWWITSKPVGRMAAWRNAIHAITDWAPWPIGVTVAVGVLIVGLNARLVWLTVRQLWPARTEPATQRALELTA